MRVISKYINFVSKCIDWFFNLKHLYKEDNNLKNLLIYTNFIFFIVVFSLIKVRNNNNLKHYITYFLIIIMGLVSSKYHHCQCHSSSYKKANNWQNIDVLMAISLSIIGMSIYSKNINIKSFISILITLSLFVFPSKNNNMYIIFHSIWHIMVGLVIYLLIIDD